MFVDSSNNVYFTCNNRIYVIGRSAVLRTFTGTGDGGSGGDGGSATSAQLNGPQGVIVDSLTGNVFVADSNNNKIRKISSAGIITTYAGVGTYGYSGDNGAATSAELAIPQGIAIGNDGNLYIADYSNHVIRLVTTTGIITTIAGNGVISTTDDGRMDSGDGGKATSAQLHCPAGVAFDTAGNNLYIADSLNSAIRLVTSAGIITTYAGTLASGGYSGDGGPADSAQLGTPEAVVWDGASSSLYIADGNNNNVRLVSSDGIITTFAGTGIGGSSGDGGPASNAQLNTPWAVALDAKGR